MPFCQGPVTSAAREIIAPIHASVASCSSPSRRGLEASAHAEPAVRRPALTASRHEAGKSWVGTKKRANRSNKETSHSFRFLCSPAKSFLRPDLPLPRRRAETLSRLAVAQAAQHPPAL